LSRHCKYKFPADSMGKPSEAQEEKTDCEGGRIIASFPTVTYSVHTPSFLGSRQSHPSGARVVFIFS
jgi:hypothetical protein